VKVNPDENSTVDQKVLRANSRRRNRGNRVPSAAAGLDNRSYISISS